MASVSLPMASKVTISILSFLNFCAWFIALAGLARVTDNCRRDRGLDDIIQLNNFFNLGSNAFGHLDSSIVNEEGRIAVDVSAYDCGMQYSWYWVVICLQFVLVVLALGGSWSTFFAKDVVISFYSIITAMLTIYAYNFTMAAYAYKDVDYSNSNTTSKWGQGYIATAAGAIAMTTLNFIFIIIFGQEHSSAAAAAASANKDAPLGATAA